MLSQSLFAPGERQIGMFHLTDGNEVFAFFNSFAGGDEWDSGAEDWTDAVWETHVTRFVGGSAAMAADANSIWNHVPVEVLAHEGEPVALAVKGMVTYNVSLDGQPIDFLIELELVSAVGEWRIKRSRTGPQSFALVAHVSPTLGQESSPEF